MLYHRGWYRAVEAAKAGLHASLLIKHPETNELFVNFDIQIMELAQEAKWLQVSLLCRLKTIKILFVLAIKKNKQ